MAKKDKVLTNTDKFVEQFSKVKQGDKVAIFTHSMPDPDAIASALGVQWLLRKKWGLESHIFHDGVVSHQQNRTMVNVLEISLTSSSEFDPKDVTFVKTIIVDATSKNAPIKEANIVIDHHRVKDETADLAIVESVGAASTLVVELIQGLKLEFEDDIDERIATALVFGIRNDTEDLISETVTDRDYKASLSLTEHVDRAKLASIIKYPYPLFFFEAEKTIGKEGNHIVENSFFVGTLGILTDTQRDALAMISDKMVRMQGIETAVIFAIVDDRIHVSVRSQNKSIDVNSFCQRIFGKDHSGGKLGSGGASVPLGIMGYDGLDNELKEEWWNMQKKVLFKKILNETAN